jgi:hypothetical protein
MRTDGGTGTALPAAAVWLSPAFFVSEAGGPAEDVAVKETLGRLPEDAVRTLAPAAVPSVHEPTVAMPDASVTTVDPETDPPPLTTVNVTVSPPIGDPYWSFTITDGGGVTAAPAAPATEVDEFAESVVATAGCVWSPLQLTKASRSNVEANLFALTEILFNWSIG